MIEKFRSINSSFKYVHIIGVLQVIIFVLMTHCASQRAPGGGPEDKTAPELIASNLENGSLNVSTETEFIFYFSEPLDEVSVKRGLTLFPLNLTEI
ncbi:MAG: hypothetical protein KAI81_02055, partial [Candidatus Marinimicrobia bacterium]|nr:hypothetical protein [Candidatus Neomarinimicrobiota bacterium]